MAVSKVEICNMALAHIGRSATLIESIDERSVEARQCRLWYEPCRREVLEAHDWHFARRRLALALHADDPPDQWGYRYQLPSDLIAVRSIENPFAAGTVFTRFDPTANWGSLTDAVAYELEVADSGEEVTLLTDMQDAVLFYTRDQEATATFPALFVNALSHYLAGKVAMALTGKKQIQDDQAGAFRQALRVASASSANQSVALPGRDAEAIRARA